MIKLVDFRREDPETALLFADTKAEVPASASNIVLTGPLTEFYRSTPGTGTLITTAYGDTAYVQSDGTVVWKGSVEPTPVGPLTVTIDNTVNCTNIYVNYIDADGVATATKLTGETSYTITASEGLMSIFADGDMLTTSITTSADKQRYFNGGDSSEEAYVVMLSGNTTITMVM